MLPATPHILVVDDDIEIREPLIRFLQRNNYRAMGAENALTARKLLKSHKFDLAVLDVIMPGEDGITFCRSLRAESSMPVLFLTGKSSELDRVVGIEVGADDYVVKPFSPRELVARIGAILRRTHALPPSNGPAPPLRVKFDRWVFDSERSELTDTNGVSVALSASESDVLRAFLEHPNIVLSRDQLMEITRRRETAPLERTIDNTIARLRKKMGDHPRFSTIIKTVWGGGYVFAAEALPL